MKITSKQYFQLGMYHIQTVSHLDVGGYKVYVELCQAVRNTGEYVNAIAKYPYNIKCQKCRIKFYESRK